MTTINNIKYAQKLTTVLFAKLARLNHYIDVNKLNKGIIAYRFGVRRNTERKVSKMLNEKRELEEKINHLLYGSEANYLTNLRNR